jgi:hypothetical protein
MGREADFSARRQKRRPFDCAQGRNDEIWGGAEDKVRGTRTKFWVAEEDVTVATRGTGREGDGWVSS